MTRPPLEIASLEPSRVCIVKPSALGDVVNALPVLSALRARWPAARLSWVINRGLAGLLAGHPDLDDLIPFDRSAIRPTPRGLASLARFGSDLRRRRFDLAVNLQGLFRSGLMTRLTGAPARVGLADAREGATRFYTHLVPMPPEAHAVDRMLAVARALGVPPGPARFVVAGTDDDRAWARATLARVPRPRVVLNPGARWATKRWPPAHFAEVALRAVRTRGAGLVAVGGPEDRELVEAIRLHLGDAPLLDLSGRTTLPQLAALAAESDVVLSNDTGPLHLAAAAGARVVGVYTCTSPRLNGPYGDDALAVATEVWCAASYIRRCGRLECMSELTPDAVWPAVAAQLDLSARVNPSAA